MGTIIPDLIENQHDTRGRHCSIGTSIPDLIENQHDTRGGHCNVGTKTLKHHYAPLLGCELRIGAGIFCYGKQI